MVKSKVSQRQFYWILTKEWGNWNSGGKGNGGKKVGDTFKIFKG